MAYGELVSAHEAVMAAQQEELAKEAAARVQAVRDVLTARAGEVQLRKQALVHREELIATGGLHKVHEVFDASTALDIQEFLDHQAKSGHPHATTFEPAREAVPAVKGPDGVTLTFAGWSLHKPAKQPAVPPVEVLPAEPEWSVKAYPVGSTGSHWVSGLPTPRIAVVTTEGSVGSVPSRLSADNSRLEMVTTERPTPLEIGDDGQPKTPVLGTYMPVQQLGEGALGSALVMPDAATRLLIGIASGEQII